MPFENRRPLVIRGAHLVDPAQGIDGRRDLLIEEGRVAAIEAEIGDRPDARVIDASGLIAAPAFIDVHTHLREPGGEGSETVRTGAWAAVKGGYSRIFAMPNTRPVCDNTVAVKQLIDRAKEGHGVRVYPVACVTRGMKGENLTELGALRSAGAFAFSDDGLPIANAELMRMALECTRDIGAAILTHAEDLTLTGEGVMHEGAVALRLGLHGIPRQSESTFVARDCSLSLATGGRLHVCHVSNANSLEAIAHYKRRGAPVTAEVTPHHLTLTHERVRHYDTNAKMKPPLCEESDRRALVEALESGLIDCIATDHAPHAPALKADTFDAAPFGIVGMDCAFAVLHSAFVVPGTWSLSFLIEKMTAAPARVAGNQGRWGSLAPGLKGDVVLLDTRERFTLGLEHLGSKSRNCPWLGEDLTGRPVMTVVEGRIAYADAHRFEAVA